MSRQAQNNAQNTYNTSSALTGSSETNANDIYGNLMGTYQNEITNPTGFNPTEQADMNTAAQQSAGGALGAATGKATQQAAANRNSGSFAPVLDEASRAASRNLSSKALGVQNQNAMLKQNQQQSGIAGEAGLESMENNDVLSSLGLQNQSNNSLINAGNSGWFQNMLGLMNAGSGSGFSTAGGTSVAF